MDEELTFAEMLTQAVNQKSAAMNGAYSLRVLAAAANVDYSHISRLMHGKRKPTTNTIKALAGALEPFLPLDAALLAAGFAPSNKSAVRQFLHGPADFLGRIAGYADVKEVPTSAPEPCQQESKNGGA